MSPPLTIRVDAEAFTGWLGQFGKQATYAISVALNRTADDVNAALRAEIPTRFVIREPRMLTWLAPVQLPYHQRATKTNLTAIVDTEGKAQLLAPFETGMPKTAPNLMAPIAIPTRALRPTPTAVVPRAMYPKNLRLVPRRGVNGILPAKSKITARGRTQIQGKDRTFVLSPFFANNISDRQWGVYQRVGPKRDDIRMLWRFTTQVPRPRILDFAQTADRVVGERWDPNMSGALAFALATAK